MKSHENRIPKKKQEKEKKAKSPLKKDRIGKIL